MYSFEPLKLNLNMNVEEGILIDHIETCQSCQYCLYVMLLDVYGLEIMLMLLGKPTFIV